MRTLPAAILLALLAPAARPQEAAEPRIAATLLWSEAYTVGIPHGGSGLRDTPLDRPAWRELGSRGIKSFRVRPGRSRPLWLCGGDLVWAVDALPGGGDRMVGPPWLSEVMDLLEENGRLWVAWAGGAARSDDGGRTWQDLSRGLPATFVHVLARTPEGRIVAGTEEGLALWDEGEGAFRPAGLAGQAIRALLPHAGFLYAGTLRDGAWRLAGDLSGDPEFMGLAGCTVADLAAAGDVLYAATNRRGVCARGLGPGRPGDRELGAWRTLREWAVDASALLLLETPGGPTLYAGTMGRGVWVSRDGGGSWTEFGLPGGHVTSLLAWTPPAAAPLPLLPAAEDPEKRKLAVRQWFLAERRRAGGAPGLYTLRWQLEEPGLEAAALAGLGALLAAPAGDMFFQFPAAGAWWRCRELLPPGLKALFRRALLAYPGYRGDTENHLAMWHAALYLTAAAFPEAGAEEWHTGRTSAENLEFARKYLENWIGDVFRRGQMEYDSPHYGVYFLGPLLLLHDFAPEERMRRLAEAALHLLAADYAADLFRGIYGGAHSRQPRGLPFEMEWDPMAGFAYLWFGELCPGPPALSGPAALAAQSGYRCPALIGRIAKDRAGEVVHYERKRVRTRWRYHGEDRNPPVFKVHFLSPAFSLGSCQGGVLQPIQQHSWGASWRDGEGRARTLFTLHPHIGPHELATFFPEDPLRLPGVIRATKPAYFDPDKWVAASPCERLLQDRGTLLALYRLPPGERPDFVTAYLPAPPGELVRAGRWRALASGPVFAALWVSGEAAEEPAPAGGTRLRCRGGTVGFVAEVARADAWPGLADFLLALAAREPALAGEEPALSWRSLAGRELVLGWPDRRAVDGQPWRFPEDALFAGPWLQSRLGSGVVAIRHGGEELRLDLEERMR